MLSRYDSFTLAMILLMLGGSVIFDNGKLWACAWIIVLVLRVAERGRKL